MVVYILSLQAEALDGVTAIRFQPTADLCVSVRNPLDAAQVREEVVIDRTALEVPMESVSATDHHHHHHHRNHTKKKQHYEAPCHFALKWPDATTRATIRVLSADDDHNNNKKQTALLSTLAPALTAAGAPVALLALECETIQPTALHLRGTELEVTTPDGQVFTTLEWQDRGGGTYSWETYDMANGSTSIVNLKATFQ